MPLVFNVHDGYSAGTGHLSGYLTDTQSSFSTVPKISRVILCLLLGSLYLRPGGWVGVCVWVGVGVCVDGCGCVCGCVGVHECKYV